MHRPAGALICLHAPRPAVGRALGSFGRPDASTESSFIPRPFALEVGAEERSRNECYTAESLAALDDSVLWKSCGAIGRIKTYIAADITSIALMCSAIGRWRISDSSSIRGSNSCQRSSLVSRFRRVMAHPAKVQITPSRQNNSDSCAWHRFPKVAHAMSSSLPVIVNLVPDGSTIVQLAYRKSLEARAPASVKALANDLSCYAAFMS